MGEAFFPINDLLRRKFQTILVMMSLTFSVASTLFLLLFADGIGLSILFKIEGSLTAGISAVLSRFLIFVGALILLVGVVVISFMVFVMMSQRVKDIGLIKATGCPNDMLFGYFFNELLVVTLTSCILGVALGLVAYFSTTSLFSTLGSQVSQKPLNFWLIPLVFILSILFSLAFGAKPIMDATKIKPAEASSPVFYLGLAKEAGFKTTSKSGFVAKMAFRNLTRHKSATVRIVLCLTTVFTLITVAVAGAIIADQTTENWIGKATGGDTVLIAHREMCEQYVSLLSKFYGGTGNASFNYTDEKYSVPQDLIETLNSTSEIAKIDTRFVIEINATEVSGYVYDPETQATVSVGDDRKGELLLVGVQPETVLKDWFLDGRFLVWNKTWEAVVGDSIASKMFSKPLNEGIKLLDEYLNVVGVCVDPINNGNVAYVPLKALQNMTGILESNIIMAKINSSTNRSESINRIKNLINTLNPTFEVRELNEVMDKNISFLNYVWSIVMLLPLFASGAASLCLLAYVVLSVDEQRLEFGILRAVGARPRTILAMISLQNLMVLLSSFAVGVALGLIGTLLFLIPDPLVSSYGLVEIVLRLAIALFVTSIFSLYPAIRFSRKPILDIIR